MNYLLSIVIPTKNRYDYLIECVQTLLQFNSEEVEIVISDNSDDNTLFLEVFNERLKLTPNLKYYYTKEELSQTGNSNVAFEHATGKYCCYIGDDDSIPLEATKLVKYLNRNSIEAAVCDVATYHWPDIIYEGKEKASLSFRKNPLIIKKLKSKQILNDVLNNGIQDIKYLSRAYHGIVSFKVLNKVKELTGSYFPGPSPDMANAIACTLQIYEYIYINQPLIISGYSYKSAGGMGLRGAHSGKLSSAKQLSKDVEKNWTIGIPRLWLGYTMWLESGLKALKALNRDDLYSKANFYAMYAKIWLRYPQYRKEVFSYLNSPLAYYKFISAATAFMYRYFIEKYKQSKLKKNKKIFSSNLKYSLTESCKVTNNYLKNILNDIDKF